MRRVPHLLKIAILTLVMAPCMPIAGLLLPADSDFRTPFMYLGFGLLLFGSGEILNHPVQTGCNFTENEKSQLRRFKHRQRNPTGLGNLFDISGLLLFFTGLTEFISF
jgi:hypothetical protein